MCYDYCSSVIAAAAAAEAKRGETAAQRRVEEHTKKIVRERAIITLSADGTTIVHILKNVHIHQRPLYETV